MGRESPWIPGKSKSIKGLGGMAWRSYPSLVMSDSRVITRFMPYIESNILYIIH